MNLTMDTFWRAFEIKTYAEYKQRFIDNIYLKPEVH